MTAADSVFCWGCCIFFYFPVHLIVKKKKFVLHKKKGSWWRRDLVKLLLRRPGCLLFQRARIEHRIAFCSVVSDLHIFGSFRFHRLSSEKKKKWYGVCEKNFLATAMVIENFNTSECDVAFCCHYSPKRAETNFVKVAWRTVWRARVRKKKKMFNRGRKKYKSMCLRFQREPRNPE